MSTRVFLQIGERSFQTTKETLADGSEYFQHLFSNAWKEVSADEPVYVDADPDAFGHILRYLRHGIFPLIYEESKGHDYAMYGLILEEAKMLGIHALTKWLEQQKYNEAMKTDYFRTGKDKNALIKMDTSLAVLRPTKDVCAQYREIWHCANGRRACFDNSGFCGGYCGSDGEMSCDDNHSFSSSSEDEQFSRNRRKRPAIKHFGLYEMSRYHHSACVDRPAAKGKKRISVKDETQKSRIERHELDGFKVFPRALDQPAFPTPRPSSDPLRHKLYRYGAGRRITRYTDWSEDDGERE